MKFSEDVLNYLANVVAAQQVTGSQADFDEAAALLGKTRRELLAALAEYAPEPEPAKAKAAKKVTHNGRVTKVDA